jgi:23S rRNA pseudouridine1911/1915/1917 synthase
MEEYLQQDDNDQEELYEHHRIVADPGQGLIRVDKFLTGRIENISRNKIQNAAKAGNILVNGLTVKPNHRIHPNDLITVVLPTPVHEFEIVPEDIPFEKLYEDDDILVINKPAGLVVHPGHGNMTGTLLNGLLYYYRNSPNVLPALVHRIDKDTSGVLLIGKNEIAQAVLGKQFFDHTITRKYIALIWGDIKDDTGTITGHIGRNPSNRLQMFVFPDGDNGKPAVTHYTVIERFGYVTLIECRLETGRTHQIRAHLKSIGHPLFNDERYGGDKILKGTTFTKYKQFIQNCKTILPRQALHAISLGFEHPASGKQMYFETPVPEDFGNVIIKWRHYIQHRELFMDE